MESEDLCETLRALKQAGKFFEAYEVTRFTGHRKTQDGIDQEVEVEVLDAGPDVEPHRRYLVVASAEEKKTIGGPGHTPREALAGFPWYKLDS